MTNQKPIEPLPSRELVEQWHDDALESDPSITVAEFIATQAARWGYTQRGAINEAELQKARDEELEAVIAWMMKMSFWGGVGEAIPALRAARRPKPKSQAEEALGRCNDYIDPDGTIRAALERLRELEGGQ